MWSIMSLWLLVWLLVSLHCHCNPPIPSWKVWQSDLQQDKTTSIYSARDTRITKTVKPHTHHLCTANCPLTHQIEKGWLVQPVDLHYSCYWLWTQTSDCCLPTWPVSCPRPSQRRPAVVSVGGTRSWGLRGCMPHCCYLPAMTWPFQLKVNGMILKSLE